MEFNCEVKISENDYIQFGLYNSLTTDFKFFPITFVVLFIAVHDIIITLLITVLLWLLLKILLKIQLKMTYKSNKLMQSSMITIYINENGIREVSETQDTKIAYENVYKVRESSYAIYIYIAKNSAVIIPKRVFQGAYDNEKLRGLLTTNIDPTKVKLKK
ncbi:hypothetical protein SDC9_61337 [bioreactor metagenome]|uniref:YcxB-like C-terminal domain-containing protein n=1 Tax=bioreactor metagenome TaxID=1076179 RepID=A0A644XL59_9ZZZZ